MYRYNYLSKLLINKRKRIFVLVTFRVRTHPRQLPNQVGALPVLLALLSPTVNHDGLTTTDPPRPLVTQCHDLPSLLESITFGARLAISQALSVPIINKSKSKEASG